jgi:hypothetical protein
MVALTCNLDLLGARLFASWTAVTLAGWYYALAWYVRTSDLLSG